MKYCSSCGNSVGPRVPNGDNRERFVCDACGTIHYQNPKIVTGCLPVYRRSGAVVPARHPAALGSMDVARRISRKR